MQAKYFDYRFTEERLNRNSARFNTIYGGLNPDVSNAVFVYGQHDPWSILGRRTNLSDDAVSIIIQGKDIVERLIFQLRDQRKIDFFRSYNGKRFGTTTSR